MVELNHRERTIKVKVVYYGPAVGGKTTNLQVLHQHAGAARRGELVSINSAQDRTILFDLLPLKASGFRGFDLRLQVLAVPGQAMYAATRRLVLKGADSLVFVANSASDRWEENVQSFREMTENLIAHQLDPSSLPLILQYNKRDLPDVTPIDFMDRTLNARKVEAIPAVAVRGEGVLETFSAVLTRTMQDLGVRYQIVEVGRGQSLQQWTRQTMMGLFGTDSLMTIGGAAVQPPATVEQPVGPPTDRRTVKLNLPPETLRRSSMGPDARANETLVESYAQAAANLSDELAIVREERDNTRHRLKELEQALGAAQEVLAGQPIEAPLRTVLGPMASAAGTRSASFLVPTVDGSWRAAVLRGLTEDPLLRSVAGRRHLVERIVPLKEPRLQEVDDALDLGEALGGLEPAFAAVLSAPVRTPSGLQGIGLLYFTPDDVLPRPDVLGHVASLARAVAASLELVGAMSLTQEAERTLQMAMVGAASMHGMEDALSSLMLLRDRMDAMRRREDAPKWMGESFTRLSPLLQSALGTGRSLIAFSQGVLQLEPVLLDELLEEARAAGTRVQIDPAAETVRGDAVLLRLAVNALLAHVRTSDKETMTIVASADRGQVQLRLGGVPAPDSRRAELQRSLSGPDVRLAFVQRIAQLHGGTLRLEVDGQLRLWTILVLQRWEAA
jgi:signal recognition particle receptor subunit beta